MKQARIGKYKAYFENDYGVKFIAFAFGSEKQSFTKWALCFDGFSKGKNLCKYVKGGENLESVSECYALAETITAEA